MPKHKRPKRHSRPSKPHPPSKTSQKQQKKQAIHHQPSQQAPARPWRKSADLLLIGEGDFSFAHSLYTHHHDTFRSLTATCYDSRENLLRKYPQAERYIKALETPTSNDEDDDVASEDLEPDDEDERDENTDIEVAEARRSTPSATVLYSIDARKISKPKTLKSRKFDCIIFNFPHIGGLSTDVNRQVRCNQSLLVDFFNAAKPLLRAPSPASNRNGGRKGHTAQTSRGRDADDGRRGGGGDGRSEESEPGKVMVTLFEREPYTLWNIRDLARHCGYAVERSWRFEWGAWEGYVHARTCGNLRARGRGGDSEKNGVEEDREGIGEEGEEFRGFSDDDDANGRGDQGVGDASDGRGTGKRPGRWHGEEREARTYLFCLKQEGQGQGSGKKRKRKGEESDSE